MKLKKGDNVTVIAGADKGKKGAVLKVLRADNAVIVDGVNVKKIHKKKSVNKPGTIIEMAMPINASNVKVTK